MANPTRKRKRDTNIGTELADRWSSPLDAQDENDPRRILGRPLGEDEKIPITQDQFDYMVKRSIDRTKALHPNDLAALFRVSEEDTAPLVHQHVASRVIENSPHDHGAEESFISLWDDLICRTLTLVLRGIVIRHRDRGTSTGLLRPDFGYLIRGHSLFRGEERAPESRGEPIEELKDKIVHWTYGILKYILGESLADFELIMFVEATLLPVQQ